MSRSCSCMGGNPNCYKCGGIGIISDASIADQTKTDWSLLASRKKVKYSSKDDSTYGDDVHTSVVGKKKKGLATCFGKKKKPSMPKSTKNSKNSRRKKRNVSATVEIYGTPLGRDTKAFSEAKQKTQLLNKTPKKKKAKDSFNNPFAGLREQLVFVVENGRKERSLDGARGYHNFREDGRFGSHPSYDGDSGD